MSDSTAIQFVAPWYALDDSHAAEADALAAELQRELAPPHPLFGLAAIAVARRQDCDDVLFRIGQRPERYAVVHLTWTGRPDHAPEFPCTEIFNSVEDFTGIRMKEDSLEFDASS